MWDHRARIETFTAENIDSIDQFRGLAKALAEAELAYTTAVSGCLRAAHACEIAGQEYVGSTHTSPAAVAAAC